MFNIDKKYWYIILGVLVVVSLVQYLSDPQALLALVLTIPGVIIAITFHEYAHAWVADKLGDDTPRNQGRLTLNPLAHLDPFGFIMLLFAHFGWGKPVEINPRNFNRTKSMSAQEAMVSVAGPIMNLILAIVFMIIYCILCKFATKFFLGTTVGVILGVIIQTTIQVNIGLGIFNLVPLPPLDGSKILMHFLPYNAKNWFIEKQNIFYIIFLLLWITGLVGFIIAPVINTIYNGLVWVIAGKMFGMM